MHAQVGDEIVVDSVEVAGHKREGEILDVIEHEGLEHYKVRWDDGKETIFFPGADAHVVHTRRAGKR